MSARSSACSSALQWAFKRVSLEINAILISILDFNGKKSIQSTFLVQTEFGNFKVKLVKLSGDSKIEGFDTTDFHLVVPIKMFVTAYLFKMFQMFGLESEFANREKLYKTRSFKLERQNIYEIPLKCIEEILVTFFESTDLTKNYGITFKLNKARASVRSPHKAVFSVRSLLNEAV